MIETDGNGWESVTRKTHFVYRNFVCFGERCLSIIFRKSIAIHKFLKPPIVATDDVVDVWESNFVSVDFS